MTIWSTIILFANAIPNLSFTIRFIENVKYEIIGGYASDFFIQRNVIYGISYSIFYMLSFAFITIFSVTSIFKPKMIRLVGITIIAQNALLLFLRGWDNFLINELNDTVLIDIKLYLGIIIVATIVFILFSFKQKAFYLILGVLTLLQCINTISLVTEYKESINNIYVIFECFSEIFILISYWAVLLCIDNKSTISTNE